MSLTVRELRLLNQRLERINGELRPLVRASRYDGVRERMMDSQADQRLREALQGTRDAITKVRFWKMVAKMDPPTAAKGHMPFG
jgi:hypothetical protein